MHVEQKMEMQILTEARRAIDADHATANELPDIERDRRVAVYAVQVEASGRITTWLPPAEPRTVYRSRFSDGDILRTRRA